MKRIEWEQITKPGLAGFAAGLAGFLLLVFRSEPGFVFLLDHANLLFHEAGHPIVGLISSRLEPYGGTLGQLMFPCILAVGFCYKGQPFGVAATGIWFFENFLNIARYIADARKLELPLVGGGDHDWNTILSRWNLLQHEASIAAVVRFTGWTGMMLMTAWLLWRAWRDSFRQNEISGDHRLLPSQ